MTLLSFLWRELTPTRDRLRVTLRIDQLSVRGQTVFRTILALALAIRHPAL